MYIHTSVKFHKYHIQIQRKANFKEQKRQFRTIRRSLKGKCLINNQLVKTLIKPFMPAFCELILNII